MWGSEISQMINSRSKQNESFFAAVWSRIILVINTYNFFTCFFWMGIIGYPHDVWYLLEILSEILILIDLGFRYIVESKFKFLWNDMHLLHDQRKTIKPKINYFSLIAAVP